MGNNHREEIHNNLSLKDTYELLEIWKTNDRVEWSNTAFEVLQEILAKRIGELPPQDEPILSYDNVSGEISNEELGLEEWEAKLIDSESQPDFYDTSEVIELRKNIDKVAKVVIIVYALSSLFLSSTVKQIVGGNFPSASDMPNIVLDLVLVGLLAVSNIVVVYFPLKALTHILRILMEMEFNSRIKR
ncbi:MAG: hypothetical protein ACOYZ8_16815 [Chloroflexota bacterium]